MAGAQQGIPVIVRDVQALEALLHGVGQPLIGQVRIDPDRVAFGIRQVYRAEHRAPGRHEAPACVRVVAVAQSVAIADGQILGLQLIVRHDVVDRRQRVLVGAVGAGMFIQWAKLAGEIGLLGA